MSKYFGSFSDRDSVVNSVEAEENDPPTDDEILFASYGGAAYEGDALVIYERGGRVYEVHGSHCSCYGLEGQWEPEETTWAALATRSLYEHDKDAEDALASLVASRTGNPTPDSDTSSEGQP